MRTAILFGGIAAAGMVLSSAALLAAQDATAGTFGREPANLTIATLEAQGFDVKVNRIGSAPLDQCFVTDIGNVRDQTQLVRRGDDLIRVVVRRSVNVTVDCSAR